MGAWQTIFQGVQAITQSARSLDEGLRLAIEFARSDRRTFDDPEYWNRVERHASRMPLETVIGWAREGLGKLEASGGWDFLVADFGDCPEIFHLFRPGCQPSSSEEKFRTLCFADSVISFDEFAGCLATDETDTESGLYDGEVEDLAYHNVAELKDEVLTWNAGSMDFSGDNGYLLWLALGSLALLEPLRDTDYCRTVLRGRQHLYLLTGFEEIFLYLATVTPEGLRFERPGF